MNEPKIDLEIGSDLKGILIIECGECNNKNKIPLYQASPDNIITCICGKKYQLTGDDIRKIQEGLDNLKRTLDSFSKSITFNL
jgi:uncharacterized protein YlzI (FlbEa/FlbD family)